MFFDIKIRSFRRFIVAILAVTFGHEFSNCSDDQKFNFVLINYSGISGLSGGSVCSGTTGLTIDTGSSGITGNTGETWCAGRTLRTRTTLGK